MSPRAKSIALTAGLIGSGALAWGLTARPLSANREIAVPLNPLGINRSPYGEVFAIAMQGPIDTDFHIGVLGGADHRHKPGETCSLCGAHESESSGENARGGRGPSLKDRFQRVLASLNEIADLRTNPKPAGRTLKLHVRREAEDKLRFAYQLDPSNYANYNSLHFFLTEPAVGTRPELTPSAKKLAEDTIQYCLKQDYDPRPALTAAAACTNILHLMFDDRRNSQPRYTTRQMRECLDLLDHCLAKYDKVSELWDQTGNWQLLSTNRIRECEERSAFIRKIRDAADKTIQIFEGDTVNHQASTH